MREKQPSPRWDNQLSLVGKAIVEKRRSRFVKGYNHLVERGYYVVGEVSPTSGRLLRRGSRARITMVQELVAQEEIEKLQQRELWRHSYEWAEGTVVPIRRHMRPSLIALPEHVRAYKHGITLFAREDTLAELESELREDDIDEFIASVFSQKRSLLLNELHMLQ